MTTSNSQHDLLPNGLYVDPLELVERIAREMDMTQWNAETLERISRCLRDAGFDIREPRGKNLPQ